MATFGPGDYGGYNDWAFSGGSSFWTNWNTSTFSTGTLGRIQAIAARWDGYSPFCSTTTGHNDLWNTGNTLVASTGNFGTTARGAGTTETMHNASCSDLWTATASFYIGFSRTQSQCSIHAWKDGSNGGYAGKSAGDGTNSGGTTNWGGTTNGGMPVFGTIVSTLIYVRRASAWTQIFTYVLRSGVMTHLPVSVRRAGAWTPLNFADFMNRAQRHIPTRGLEIEVNVGDGWERGLAIEGPVGWFGSTDPTRFGVDWTRPGHWAVPADRFGFTPRLNSFEPEEVVYRRWVARERWLRSLKEGNFAPIQQRDCGCGSKTGSLAQVA